MSDLTVKDVALELNCSRDAVRSLIASGDLKAYRLRSDRGQWRIEPSAIDAYREERKSRDPWARTRPRRSR